MGRPSADAAVRARHVHSQRSRTLVVNRNTLQQGGARRALGALLAVTVALPLGAQGARTTKPAPPPKARAVAAPAPSAPEKVTEVEGITEYRLGNGLRVLLFPDASKPTVTVNITYLVGSRHEGYGETGMAHLLEHMVFKGTPRHPNIPQELTDHGARPNGTTWDDRTNYFETVPATPANVEWALDLEADRMVHSHIAKKDLETEFTVVRNEFESGENSPFNVLLERTASTAYLWHNYGKSTIGARSDIEGVPIERLQAFYHRYYQPDNAVLAVAGKFEPAAMLAQVNRLFGVIPKPVRALDKGNMLFPTYTREPVQDGERTVTLRRTGDVQVAMQAFHVVAGPHPDFAAVEVLGRVLGEAPAGRLYQALVSTKLAASVGSFALATAEPSLLLAFATVRGDGSLDSAVTAINQVVARITGDQPVTAAEVERVKATALKNIDLELNNAERVGLTLSEFIAAGDWRLLFLTRDRLKAVSAADVNRVAKAYLKPSNRTLGLFVPDRAPDRAEVPEAGDVAAMVKDYKGQQKLAEAEAFDPSPANIDKRTVRETWPGGIKAALLAKQTRGNSVVANLTLRYGTPATLTNLATTSQLTASMLSRGTTTKTRQQLKEAFDQLKVQWSVTGGGNQVQARLETTRPNLTAAIALLGEVLRQPAFDAKEFEELVRSSVTQIEAGRSEPQTQAVVAVQRRLNPVPRGAPTYTPTIDEQIADLKAATLDGLKAFHARFYGAQAATLAVVGDFDPAEVKAAVTKAIGGWAAPQAFARVPTPYVGLRDTAITLETPDKANAFFVAATNVPLRDDDPDYPAMLLATHIMGGGFLNSRFATRIRQKEGLSYGVGSQMVVRQLDRSGVWITFAIYNPTNVVRLEQAFKDELAKARADGFTADEVEKARQAILQQQLQSRANDGELVSALGTQAYLGRTAAFDAELEAKLKAVSVADVSNAFRKLIAPENLAIVRAGDFKGKGVDPDRPVSP
ncbi:MAG: insulinase family protein [Gemmatimonadetes bacterium]|nr:insulinase family protein [Gemmatimonadota bacterium]